MNEQQSILSLSWDQIKESPGFSEANEEQKAAAINQYHAQIAQYLKDNGASDQRLEAVEANRRARLYEVVPLLKQPEDIGVLENTVNAFTKSLGSFRENIFFNLAEQNPEEAQRFHRNLERQNPTYPGIAEKVGRITGQMIPTGVALLAAPLTAGTSLSAISAIAVGSFYGASAAGGALGDIYAYEQATGEDVSSGKTAAVMAGHAAFEIGMEMVGLRTLTGIARRAGAGIGTDAAAELGNSILRRLKSETAAKAADAITDYFTHNKAARLALGWVGMGATEGLEEGATQIAQNVTDKLYRERDSLDGVMQSMGEGSLGGLLLGPLAIGVQMNAESGYHARVAAQGEGVLESAYLNLARKQAGADGSITEARDRIRSEYGEVDAEALRNPDFLLFKEFLGMTGVEAVPVRGGSKAARGVQMTGENGTPVVLVNEDFTRSFEGMREFVIPHEVTHALGIDNAVRIALDVAGKLPGFESYKQRLQQVYATNQLGGVTDTTAANELVADVFGQTMLRPQFLGTLIDSVSANPEVARTTVTKLRDMRGRLEKMGRRVDAWLTTPENDKYTGLPRAAMQAAQGRINAETVALDAMIGQFTAGFEKALAQAEQPAEGTQIVGGTEEPEDVLAAAGVADALEEPPFSAGEGASDIPLDALGRPEPRATISVYGSNWGRLREGAWFSMTTPSNFKNRIRLPVNQDNLMAVFDEAVAQAKAMGYEAVLGKDMEGFPQARLTHTKAKQLEEADAAAESTKWAGAKPVYLRFGKPPASGYSTDYSSGTREKGVSVYRGQMLPSGEVRPIMETNQNIGSMLLGGLAERGVYVVEGEEVGIGADGEPVLRITSVKAPRQAAKAIFGRNAPPLSPAEGMTPEQVFEKGYSPKRGDFLDNPFGKALRQAWEENKGTSYVLKTLFLDRNIRIVPPGYGKTATRDLYDPNSMDEGAVQQEAPTASQRERLAEYRSLPDWLKLKKNENPAKYDLVEWTAEGVGNSDLLGTSGYGGEETALGFIREQGLAPEGLTDASLGGNFMNEETRSVDADQLMEKLTSLVQGVPSKAALRQQVEKMMREETKDAARSIASLKTYNDIQARRIDKRTMLKIAQTPALVDKLVNEPKLNTVQRLVSRDDLQPGIVVRQADNLYAVRSIAPDRVPEMVNLRGGRAFDYTEVAVDDPMNDPDMAKDYRFGMELPPVVPYYGVQAAFPASASVEVQDMIDDLPAGDSVPFSAAEGMDADYMKAVEAGDMATAQRMVDEAAKAAGFTEKVYHFTNRDFTAFDIERGRVGGAGAGIWLTDSPKGWKFGTTRRLDLFLDPGKVRPVKSQWDRDWVEGTLGIEGITDADRETMLAEGVDTLMNATGYASTFYVATRPEQVKSSDPVTYDDAGNVIPLSQRFTPSNDIRFSPAEGMTPIDSFLAPKGSLMRETYDMKAKAAEAQRILNSNGASTFAQKAMNLGKADTAEAGVASMARNILFKEAQVMLDNPDQARRERFFGTSDEELMKAKAIEIADERHIFYSETGVELVSAQFDENGNHLPPTEQRRFGDWMEWISHTFGMAGQRDVKKMNLTKEKVEKADAVRDAMDDLIADLANLPKAEFEPALQSRVARIRKEAVRVQLQRIKDGVPLSAADEGKAGDILDRVFADPGAYYRRLKSKAGSDFRNELERELGAGAADLVAEQLEAHIAMFPDLAGKPKRAPTVTEEAEIDLINEMLKGHEKKLEALKASIYTGEVGQFITENFRARLPQLNLRLAALSASMTPEEQAAEIDKAFREIAKTILEEKKKERGGAALVQQGLLSVEGIEASLAEAKEAVKARQVAFTAIAPAVNMALRNASVSIADLLKVSQQKVGRIQFNLGQQIAGKVTEELLKMPELAEFPEAIDAAAQKVADSVEAYIAKRLEDSVDTIGNESMATWNKANRAARGLVRPLLDLFYGPVQGPKPYAETAKGTAAALLAEPALFRARVEAALAEQKAKGDLLENDVLGEMARGLGLPANATWDQIATTLTAKPIPDALARRVIAEHMAQTGGSILELADVLNPTADSAFERVVDDLTREFGEGTRALWRDALTKQVEARRAIIAKRILSKRKAKGQKVNAYDKMIRAIAGGMFDDETMALALAESVGLPELTQETRDALRPLLAAEVAALRAYGPDDPITHRATDAISGLLARELIKSWPKKGWFTKLDEQRLKSAFYSGALSGFRTWAVTNPASSWSKTFQTILETAAKNALLDPVLKKQGLQGVAAALSHMIRTMSLDASRLALREGIAPQSIERGPYLDAKVPESGLWDTDANANVVHKTLFSMWGLAAKYVRRAIMAGDASPYQSGFSFGSYEAARKIVLMEAEAAGETLSLTETQRRVYDKLALGPDGKPTAAQMEQAKAELAQAGVTPSDAEVRLRAESIARRSRPDYVNAAGRFLGEQGTFTNDVGVHYAQVEGMPGEPGLGQRLLNWVNSAKNSSNPAVALLTTAIVPFPGIASRIIDQSMNYLALPGYFRWRALNGLAETAETPAHRAAYAEAAGLQMVRMVEGTIALAVMALLVAMQDEDDPWLQITGAGPADFRKNYQWREAGNRPMTLKLGKVQVDYRWFPLASLLFAVGTWQDQKLEDPDDRKGLVTAAAMGFMTSTFNQSFMSSVADLLDVISGRDEQGAQQKLFSLVGNPVSSIVIPFSGAVHTVEQAFLPYPNAARVEDNFFKTFAKTTIARIPIMNELLPRKMNALGRAIETDRPFEADVSWKGWRRGGDEDANKVFDYVVEKQAWLPTPNALRTHVLPPESDLTKGEARRLADKDDALMTYAEYEKFMQRRGDIAIALFQKHEALLRTLPEGEAAREVMSELMSLASTQAKREAVGLRPFKPGVQPDRVIRAAVKRASAE